MIDFCTTIDRALHARPIPDAILRAARREYELRGVVRSTDERLALLCDGVVAGFVTPHRRQDGLLTCGPVYVAQAFRGRGVAAGFFRSLLEPCVACIADTNEASRRMVERAGFVRWRRYEKGWYWRRG